MKTILYAHGFGVRKDDRGLFTAIAQSLPTCTHHTIDLNDIDPNSDQLSVVPLEVQAARLNTSRQQIGHIDVLIAHSQGCLVSALLPPPHVSHMIFLTPPVDREIEHTLSSFAKRKGSQIDRNGTSKIERADGSFTLVPAEFWASRMRYDPFKVYAAAPADRIDIVIANQDEIIAGAIWPNLPPHIHIHRIDGDHNFSGSSRDGMLNLIKNLIE